MMGYKRGGKEEGIKKDRASEEWCLKPLSNLIIDFGYHLKPGMSMKPFA